MSKFLTVQELSEIKKPKPVSRQAVNKAANEGRLPFTMKNGVKEFDLDDPIIKNWLSGSKKKIQKKTSKKKTAVKTAKKKTVPKSKQKSGKAKPSQIDIPEEIIQLVDSGQLTLMDAMRMTKTDLDKIKIYETIKKTKVEAEIKRKDYIDKKLVEVVLHKTYEIDRTQLIPLKDRLIVDLSAIFGITDEELKVKAAEKIDSELWGYLKTIQNTLNKFLEKHGAEEIG